MRRRLRLAWNPSLGGYPHISRTLAPSIKRNLLLQVASQCIIHTKIDETNAFHSYIHDIFFLTHPSTYLPGSVHPCAHPSNPYRVYAPKRVHTNRAYVYRIKRVLTYIDTNIHSNHAMQSNVSEEEGRFFFGNISKNLSRQPRNWQH